MAVRTHRLSTKAAPLTAFAPGPPGGEQTETQAMNEEHYWQAVQTRDASADGLFFYGVRSTGIYCRPACPSRRPRREQVVFFAQPAAAEQAGFRACRRCRPGEAPRSEAQEDLVRRACRLIEAHPDEPLTLGSLGARIGVSPYHLQRTFKR